MSGLIWRLSRNRSFHLLLLKEHQSIFKTNRYYINNLHQSRHFSWNGFYTFLSQSTPVTSLQSVLVDAHEVSGLPWWAVILITTFGIRTIIILPLTIHQYQVMSRLAAINAGMGKIASELNKEVNVARRQLNWTEEQAKLVFRRQLKKIHNESVIRDNCHPFKSVLLVLIQVPVWICFSISLRNLTYASNAFHPSLGFHKEGLLWFTDLTSPDPIFIPLLLLITNIALIEVHSLRNVGQKTLLQKVLINVSRIVSVIVAVAATINPASVTFYWLCSSAFGIGQVLLLMRPKVRQILKISQKGNESVKPFFIIMNKLKNSFKK